MASRWVPLGSAYQLSTACSIRAMRSDASAAKTRSKGGLRRNRLCAWSALADSGPSGASGMPPGSFSCRSATGPLCRRSASAASRNTDSDWGAGAPAEIASTHSCKPTSAVSEAANTSASGLRGCTRCSFISCSNAHADSPRSRNPTMRAPPFSVWKARRMACRSCCCACGPSAHAVCAMAWRACSMTERASTKNMTRISSSSASGGAAPVAGLAAEALVDGACASAVVKSASCDVVCASERAGMSRKSGAVGVGSGLKTSSPRAASKWKAFCANADW